MTRADRGALVAFAALTAWLWLRDMSWRNAAADTLPVLIGLPLFIALGRPWRFREGAPARPVTGRTAAAGLLLALGIAFDHALPLAAGATLLLSAGLSARLEPESDARAQRLLPLVFLAFPWLALEGQVVGWWFRLSGAFAVEHLFRSMGFEVSRAGIHLQVQGLGVSVDPACAGMNVLQAALQVGVTVAAWNGRLGRAGASLSVPILLVGLAWFANTARIAFLCAIALTFGVTAAQGAFHTLGGWVVLLAVLGMTGRLFPQQEASPA